MSVFIERGGGFLDRGAGWERSSHIVREILKEYIKKNNIRGRFTLTPDQFADIVEDNPQFGLEVPEEYIELDNIELNEETPLLEEAGQFAATAELAEAGGTLGTSAAAAAAPSAGAVGTGLAIAAGTIIGGTVIGSQREREDGHKDPIVSFPDHRYIGPGNTVDSAVPVDQDDLIAREHDIAFEEAKDQQDIQEADRQGASEFLTDAIHNYNPHSLAGYVGLKTKEKVESVIGVQYPPNLPVSSSGT